MIKIFEEICDRLPEVETLAKAQPLKQHHKRQRAKEPLSPSDFVQTKFAKHPITIGVEGAFTRRRHLESERMQAMPTMAKDDTDAR